MTGTPQLSDQDVDLALFVTTNRDDVPVERLRAASENLRRVNDVLRLIGQAETETTEGTGRGGQVIELR